METRGRATGGTTDPSCAVSAAHPLIATSGDASEARSIVCVMAVVGQMGSQAMQAMPQGTPSAMVSNGVVNRDG